jgi:hypothetical protein
MSPLIFGTRLALLFTMICGIFMACSNSLRMIRLHVKGNVNRFAEKSGSGLGFGVGFGVGSGFGSGPTQQHGRHFSRVSSNPMSNNNYVDDMSDKPIILLDVDGVINMVHSKAGWNHVKNTRVRGFSINYCPSVINTLNRWVYSGLAEIRWLTTWDHHAQIKLAPELKLDYFPLGRTVKPLKENSHDHIVDKLTAVIFCIEENPNRPIVWIDDEISMMLRYSPAGRENVIKLLSREDQKPFLAVSPEKALTPEHLIEIEAFFKNPTKNNSVALLR